MAKSIDTGADHDEERGIEQQAWAAQQSPGDFETLGLHRPARGPVIEGDHASDELATGPADHEQADAGGTDVSACAVPISELVGHQAIQEVVAADPATIIAHNSGSEGDRRELGASLQGGDVIGVRDRSGDAGGEPPETGDARGELGGNDPESIRRELELRAVTRASEIIQELPVDEEHAALIAIGQADLSLAVGVRIDSVTGKNVYDRDLLAQARSAITKMSARMRQDEKAAQRQYDALDETDNPDKRAELQELIYGRREARDEVNAHALVPILTAETIAGSEPAAQLLRSRILDDRDKVAEDRLGNADYVIRPIGESEKDQLNTNFVNSYELTKTAEALGEPVPWHVMEPEYADEEQDFEITLLTLEHYNRLAQPPAEGETGSLEAGDRVREGISDIISSFGEDTDRAPSTPQLIASFPRLLAISDQAELKRQITQQYLRQVGAEIGDIPVDRKLYDDLVKAGCAVFDDPALYNDPDVSSRVIDEFGSIIGDAAEILRQDADMQIDDPALLARTKADIAKQSAEWNARIFTLRPPSDYPSVTIASVTAQPDHRGRTQADVDQLNRIYARELMKAGDPKAAKLLIEVFIHDKGSIADALTECLNIATVRDPIFGEYFPERVEALRPSESLVREMPDLGRIYNAAHAITHDDVGALISATISMAHSIETSGNTIEGLDVKFGWIDALLKRIDLLDRSAGSAVRREILPQLQNTRFANSYTRELLHIYRGVTRNGTYDDYRAVQVAMSFIDYHTASTTERGLNIWAPLARLLSRPPARF